MDYTLKNNLTNIRPTDEFKFVITDRNDFNYAQRFVKKHNIADSNTVLFSPAFNILDPRKLVKWIVKEMPDVRLNLQFHKFIWRDQNERRNGF